jgi:hypothetical protein
VRRLPRRAVLDTNLLLLWLVTETDLKLLERFKRVEQFTVRDVELLRTVLQPYVEMVTTPHILAETSNFVDQAPSAYRELLVGSLRVFIANIAELYSPAVQLIGRSEFNALGLTDTAVAELSTSAVVITQDFQLSGMIQAAGGSVINFNQLRSGYLLAQQRS